MVYPTFDIYSIQKRCNIDLTQFYETYNIPINSNEFKDVLKCPYMIKKKRP